jgi:hypothetical protein
MLTKTFYSLTIVGTLFASAFAFGNASPASTGEKASCCSKDCCEGCPDCGCTKDCCDNCEDGCDCTCDA